MRLMAVALAISFAFSSGGVFARTVHHSSNVRAHTVQGHAVPLVPLHPKYDNPNGTSGGYGNHDVWGQWGAYYGPMITVGGGGR